MGLFGNNRQPRMQYHSQGPYAPPLERIVTGVNSVIDIDYANVSEPQMQRKLTMHESDIDARRFWVGLAGTHMTFEVQVHLWKESDPVEKQKDLMNFEGQYVVFYPHRDNDPLQDYNGIVVPCFLESITWGWVNTTDYKDLALLTFVTSRLVDVTKSAQAILTGNLKQEDGSDLLDEQGNPIPVE